MSKNVLVSVERLRRIRHTGQPITFTAAIDYLPPIDYETRYRELCSTVASILEVA
ncbi:hypothetical protein [Rhodococcus sp. T7]|uniref:hypothetical protein n=1 Tax=Rhodococcus sp. T7 TaxID=627444 RepID=UPI00135AA2DB|nr:hypothetical protein [Rhodococcus sp. T7]KAF0963339.1 hypothetical protein MLGJGCBP_03531 [Rhodococcus sp. T7]